FEHRAAIYKNRPDYQFVFVTGSIENRVAAGAQKQVVHVRAGAGLVGDAEKPDSVADALTANQVAHKARFTGCHAGVFKTRLANSFVVLFSLRFRHNYPAWPYLVTLAVLPPCALKCRVGANSPNL